jgi:PAS domain S-box-containing protein
MQVHQTARVQVLPVLRGIAIALILVLAATALGAFLGGWDLLLLWLAITCAASLGGALSGGTATLVATLYALVVPLPRAGFVNTRVAYGIMLVGLGVSFIVDRLRRARTRAMASEAEARRQAHLLDLTRDAMIVHDDEGRIRMWNAGAESMYGRTSAEAIGKNIDEVLATEFPESAAGVRDAVRQSGEWEGEVRQRGAGGETLIVQSRHALIRGAAGEPDSFLEVNRNVTARRKAEDALLRSESKFRRLSDANIIGVGFANLAGFVTDANDEFLRIIGYSRQDLASGSLRIDAFRDPDWRILENKASEDLRTRGACMPFEKEYVRKDGSKIPVLMGAAMLEGSDQEMVAFVLDLSERNRALEALRHSEARLQAIFQHANIGIGITSLSGRWLAVNPKLEDILQYPGDELEEMSARENIHPNDRAPDDAQTRRLLAGEADRYAQEIRLIRKDGSVAHVHLLKSMVRAPAGQSDYFIQVIEDITVRKRIEEQLRQKDVFESVGVLAGGIAHDFNNLLTTIIGNADLAHRMLPEGHEAKTMLEDVLRGAERADQLTRQLLAYAGKGRFQITPVNLSEAVTAVVNLVAPSLRRGIRLDLQLERSLPPIPADERQIRQVVLNLALNAAEAFEGVISGEITIRTERRKVDAADFEPGSLFGEIIPGEHVVLEVRDNGCGMQPHQIPKIFDPFFTTKFLGRGLGLSAVLGISLSQKGAVHVASEPRKGTTFRVFFPVRNLGGG